MTLVDSADSILMLYAYAGTPDKGWSLFEKKAHHQSVLSSDTASSQEAPMIAGTSDTVLAVSCWLTWPGPQPENGT